MDACGDHPVFIVTPWPRYVGHVTNFNNADFLSTILGDLNKHKTALRKALPSATIIDGLELISRAGYNAEKAAAVINSGWAFDPVYPSKHVYAKMALNLLEKVAPQNMDGGQSGQRHTDNRKRSWSASNQGGGGGHSGQSRDGHHSSSSVSTGGRQTARSQQWKEGGRRDSFRSSHSGGYASGSDGGGHYDRRYSDGRSAGNGGSGGFNIGYRGKFDGGYGRGGGRGGGYGGRF